MDEITRARLRQRRDREMARAIEHGREAPDRFLEAWLKGVKKVGPQYFEFRAPIYDASVQPAASLEEVTSKWQVVPNEAFIEQSIGALSSGEATLLAVMCSFYNAEWGGRLMRAQGIEGMADIAGTLDLDSNEIVAALLVNYTGW